MKARRDIERRIQKEQKNIAELQSQIAKAEAFILGLQEALKILPKDTNSITRKTKGTVRPGSDMAKIIDLLKSEGQPMHISDIVLGLGRDDTKANRMSISGSLGRYVRKGDIFIRIGPNTFALKDMEINVSNKDVLPKEFGANEEYTEGVNPEDLPF